MLIELPLLLNEMLAAGRWPRTPEEAESQNRRPWVSTENIRRLAPDETLIYFFPPPFFTVRERSRENDFWNWPQTDPNGIDFDLAIDIGDFGLGSDAPILLDYRADPTNPRVIRLQWSRTGENNRWVQMAHDFKTFVEALGL